MVSLVNARRRTWLMRRAFLVGMLLCAVGLAACAQATATSHPSPTAEPTRTPAPAFTATPAPPVGTGWRVIGPHDLQTLFFVPGEPLTAYTCLNRGGGQRGPLTLGVSHDGGHTWAFHTTALPDTECQMAVSPTDARTIAMAANWATCEGDGCYGHATDVYISHDGGATWTAAPPVGSLRDWGVSVWLAWVKTTLFVGTDGDTGSAGSPPRPIIAASIGGGPLTPLKIDALSSMPAARIAGFYPLGSALFAQLAEWTNSPAPSKTVTITADASGAEFTTVSPVYQGKPVSLLTASADGKTLLGYSAPSAASTTPSTLLSSTDNGASWRALPALPAAQFCCFVDYAYGALDGSVVAEIQVYRADQGLYQATGIFVLRPGAETWVYDAAPPAGSVILTISADASGRPVAAWAPGAGAGLPYHPLP
jgi:hypothetical protein